MISANGTDITLPVVIDDSLATGVVYVPFNQPHTPPLGASPVVGVTPAD